MNAAVSPSLWQADHKYQIEALIALITSLWAMVETIFFATRSILVYSNPFGRLSEIFRPL